MSTTAIEQLLSRHGFHLARQKKHRVYKREDGGTFVTASTPSDRRADRQQLSTLCRVLGTDKRRLLASLERRRPRIRAKTARTALPDVALPPIALEKVEMAPTWAEKSLAKRLVRIESNRAAKVARRAERLDLFFERLSVLFVESGEIIFADNRGPKLLKKIIARRIERPGTSTIALSDQYGTADVTVEEILTNPDVLCLFNCPVCGVSFVFKDGSVADSSPEAVPGLHDEMKRNL